jgi:thiol-disulfide isomerase/thioredoxin
VRRAAPALACLLALAPAPPAAAGPPSPASASVSSSASASAAADSARPAYAVVDIDAIKQLLHKGRGHVVLVHFWASWCSPCMQELPLVDKLARELKPRGLEVLSLSLDDPRTMGPKVGALLRKLAPSLVPDIAKFDDADSFISAFDARWEGAIPALFVYDRQGQPRGSLIGESSRRDLERLVGRLLDEGAPATAGRPAPKK